MVTALLTGQSDALFRDLWLHSVLIISLWQALRLPHMNIFISKSLIHKYYIVPNFLVALWKMKNIVFV